MSSYCQLYLTCANKLEADNIANTLLVKHLIACAKQISVSSDYLWQGKIEHSDEVLLIMDSNIKHFTKVEAEIKKLHSYDTFNLQLVEVSRVSTGAANWLESELL